MTTIDLQETQMELRWLDKKLALTSNVKTSQLRTVHRGEVYQCEFGHNVGSEMRNVHPCVIIQNDSSAPNSWTVCVVPITHAATRNTFPPALVQITQQFDVKQRIIIEGYADVAQIKCVSKARLHQHICTLPSGDMKNIDKQLATITDLYDYYLKNEKKLQTAIKRADDKESKIKVLRKYLQNIADVVDGNSAEKVRELIKEALNL